MSTRLCSLVEHGELHPFHAHLPLLGGEPLMSVKHGQCNARPMVTFPATRHHCPLAVTKIYIHTFIKSYVKPLSNSAKKLVKVSTHHKKSIMREMKLQLS